MRNGNPSRGVSFPAQPRRVLAAWARRERASEPGRPADFFTVDLDDPSIAGAGRHSLLSHIVFSLERTAVRDACVGGEFVIRDGRHPLQEDIVRAFAAVQRSLWGSPE